MINKVTVTLFFLVMLLLILALGMIFLGGACWVALTIWKAVFAFFA